MRKPAHNLKGSLVETNPAKPDAALVVFNASRAFYGLPPVAEIPSSGPHLTVVES